MKPYWRERVIEEEKKISTCYNYKCIKHDDSTYISQCTLYTNHPENCKLFVSYEEKE